MVYQRRTSVSNQTLTDSEYCYTPFHSYNTRLAAKYTNNLQVAKRIDFRETSGDHNEDTYLLEEDENFSDRFSEASSNFFENTSQILREINHNNSLVKFEKLMDFDGPPCPIYTDRHKWIKNGSIILFVVVIGWYVNYVRMRLNNIQSEIDSANGRIIDIVDSRLDIQYQLSEIKSQVKDLRHTQENFKQTVHKMIAHEIDKMYSDKTGKTDFALESAGGRIVRLSPGTENYVQPKSSLLGIGISLCDGMHGPRTMIQTGTSPGECWAFKGSNGGVVIKLLGSIKINAVSLEHIPKSISPSGDSTTAPKDFSIWGMKSVTDKGLLLGQFFYKVDGPLVQTFFIVNPINDVFDFVELNIQSNHGNADFTCVYRFRVHGSMEKSKEK